LFPCRHKTNILSANGGLAPSSSCRKTGAGVFIKWSYSRPAIFANRKRKQISYFGNEIDTTEAYDEAAKAGQQTKTIPQMA